MANLHEERREEAKIAKLHKYRKEETKIIANSLQNRKKENNIKLTFI